MTLIKLGECAIVVLQWFGTILYMLICAFVLCQWAWEGIKKIKESYRVKHCPRHSHLWRSKNKKETANKLNHDCPCGHHDCVPDNQGHDLEKETYHV